LRGRAAANPTGGDRDSDSAGQNDERKSWRVRGSFPGMRNFIGADVKTYQEVH